MWVCRLPVHIGPRSVHRFYDNLRRICSFPMGRCRHRPLHQNRQVHTYAPQLFAKPVHSAGGQSRPPLRSLIFCKTVYH